MLVIRLIVNWLLFLTAPLWLPVLFYFMALGEILARNEYALSCLVYGDEWLHDFI